MQRIEALSMVLWAASLSAAVAQAELPLIDAQTGRIAVASRPSTRVPSPAARTQRPGPPAAGSRIRAATVRVEVDHPDGTSVGSGTVVATDDKLALIISCGHIFEGTAADATVRVTVFSSEGTRRLPAQVLSFDPAADVAVMTTTALPRMPTIPLAARDYRAKLGEKVISAGCDDGGPPVAEATTINDLNRYIGHARLNVTAAPEHGRSGGGLITRDFQLIGVCRGIDQEENDGVYAGLDCVYRELEKVQSQLPPPFQLNTGVTTPNLPQTPTPREAFPGRERRPVAIDVICLIQPGSNDGEQQVIHLQDASPDFLAALRREQIRQRD